MSRYHAERIYQLGEYWLGQRSGSPAWYRCWFDAATRQTRRVSLGTTDLAQAKQKLDDWFIDNRRPSNEPPEEACLAEILGRYWQGHGQHLASPERTRISLAYWLDFWADQPLSAVRDIAMQERFHAFLREKGMQGSTINRVLAAGKAAINRAWKRGEIASAPFIQAVTDSNTAPPLGRVMSIDEIGQLYAATCYEPLRWFITLLLATAGRPAAIRELTLERCQIDDRLIALNPTGRPQTKKYRPTLRMPESIVPALKKLREHYPPRVFIVGLSDQPVHSVKTAWRSARRRAGLDQQVNPYSLRHTMARWLRQQSVPAWEVAAQLGHRRPGMTITEIYAPHDPAYLLASTKAIDAFFGELRASCVTVFQCIE